MMAPEENDVEELDAVSSSAFESTPSPVSALGGWASGAGNALFAVTKGVSSRVEGVSSRVSLRAKDMLSSIGDDDEGANKPNGRTTSVTANGNGAERAAAAAQVREAEALEHASVLSESTQLAEKVVAMSKIANVVGSDARKFSQEALRCMAGPLVTVLQDAEHFDPFFANACVACMQQVLDTQGEHFAAELVEAGAAEALIPLLDPRFELVRIQCLALLEALFKAQRGEVCRRVVGVPTGMQALVDLLDDRWDEVRHEAVSLLAAFLTDDPESPPPVDLQNFVAFQEGFDKLLKASGEPSEQVSQMALAALAGALVDNPLSQKLFAMGGHVARLPSFLAVVDPADICLPSDVRQPQPAATTRRRWGWGARDRHRVAAPAEASSVPTPTSVALGNGAGGAVSSELPPISPPSPANGGAFTAGGSRAASGASEPRTARIRAALLLLLALVGGGSRRSAVVAGATTPLEMDEVRGAVARERGVMEAVCELALASSRAPVAGGPTWAEYGLPGDCQRLAMDVLAALMRGHPANEATFARCEIRGAPMAITLHGRKRLVAAAEPRNAVDALLELWLAASLDTSGKQKRGLGGAAEVGEESGGTTEMDMLDRTLNAFLEGNSEWGFAVLAGVSAAHASAAKVEDTEDISSVSSSEPTSPRHRGADSSLSKEATKPLAAGADLCGGVTIMSRAIRRGFLASDADVGSGDGGVDREGRGHARSSTVSRDDPAAAALSLKLFRRVLQAAGGGSRDLAAGIGIATEGAGRRQEASTSAAVSGQGDRQEGGDARGDDYYDELGTPVVPGNRTDGEGEEGGFDPEGLGREQERVRCSPPLTPALEVAVRLLADGYNVAVMLQTNPPVGGDEGLPSPPSSDLTRYLIALAELLVAWLCPPGMGPKLSRRLLASGANWALLRALGRALCPFPRKVATGEEGARNSGSSERRVRPPRVVTGARHPSGDVSVAYLHSLVAVIVGSFLSSAETLTRQTLSAGVARHVGVFNFCRALDSAADWVAFARPTTTRLSGEPGECRASVPASWALAGDSRFTAAMVAIIEAANTSITETIAGVPHSIEGARRTGTSREDGGANVDKARTSDACGSGAYGDLLRRQQVRIEELEHRLRSLTESSGEGHDANFALSGGQRSPTLTI